MKTSAIARKGAFFLSIFLVGICIWLLCVIFQPFEPREPEYQGKRLSDWAMEIDPGFFTGYLLWQTNQEQSELAISAIRHIGTNALPVAVRLCGAKDSWPRQQLAEWIEQYNNDHWPKRFPIQIIGAWDKNYEGQNIVWALGPMAKPIIPDLIQLLEKQDQLHEDTITMVLGAGTNAIPLLVKLLDSANPEVRLRAAIVLGYFFRPKEPLTPGMPLIVAGGDHFRPEVRAAVPILLQCLENQKLDQLSRDHAIQSLGLIHEDAPLVVPAILRLIQSQTNNWIMASGYIQLLGNFGTNAQPAVPVLVSILESKPQLPNEYYSSPRMSALLALQKIGPEAAKPAVPAVLHILESKPQWPADEYSPLRISALFTLSKIDPEAAKTFVPKLLHILESESDWPGGYGPAQMYALVALWRIESDAALPFFEKWKPSQDWLVGDLENLDPEAVEPFLEKWKASQTNGLPASGELFQTQTNSPSR